MIKEDKGQVSLEYLLIFAVSIILLIAFTLPLAQFGMEKSLDVSNSMNAKGELSKLSNAISQVYGEGQGSKQTVHLTLDKAINVKITLIPTHTLPACFFANNKPKKTRAKFITAIMHISKKPLRAYCEYVIS